MNKQNKNIYLGNKGAFTLLELIVVIIILAILGTISYISILGYNKNSRDSVRITDLSVMKTTLELFHLDAGKYPLTTDGVDIIHSGSKVWNQGIYGDSVFVNVEKLDKVPLDPLTNSNYTYSVLENGNEYELAGIVEGYDVANLNILNQIYAGDEDAYAYIVGNYNGMMHKTVSGLACTMLSLPSIIASDLELSTDLENIINNNRLVYKGYKNLPNSFKNSRFNIQGGFKLNLNNLVSYSGSCETLENSIAEQIKLIEGIQESYSGSIFDPGTVGGKPEGRLKDLMELEIYPIVELSTTGVVDAIVGGYPQVAIPTLEQRQLIQELVRVGGLPSVEPDYAEITVPKTCGVQFYNIGEDVEESVLAKYHDRWYDGSDPDRQLGGRIAASNRFCGIGGCKYTGDGINNGSNNCEGTYPGEGFNGGGTYLESTNQVMCVGGSEIRSGGHRVIEQGAWGLYDMSATNGACQTECEGKGFDKGTSVERGPHSAYSGNIVVCSCWDDCDKLPVFTISFPESGQTYGCGLCD